MLSVKLNQPTRCATLIAWLFWSAAFCFATPPQELIEAESTYIESATKRLAEASGDADARKKLAALNSSFLKHLKKLHPKVLATSREGATEVEIRIQLMKQLQDSSLPLKTLDARPLLQTLSGPQQARKTAPPPPTTTPPQPQLGEKLPTGELSSREEGKKIEAGKSFEIKGRTKDIPKGYTVAVFAGKTTASLFPQENRKDPNRRFSVNPRASDVWLGQVQFLLVILPDDVMDDIEAWYAVRNQWENAGFPRAETPSFRGRTMGSLYEKDLLQLGSRVLSRIEVEYTR